MQLQNDVMIIGGGLSGLTLACFLQKKGIEAVILEASERPGGRIHTVTGSLDTPLELGATWFSDIHVHLLELIEELGLTRYPQYSEGISLFQTKSFEPPQQFFIPAADIPSYRIAGGTGMLIHALAQKLNHSCIQLNKKVIAVKQAAHNLIVETADGTIFNAERVVVCIPPQLAAATIRFLPELPESIRQVLPAVQTWMSGAVKFTLEYDEPFWRTAGYSGMLYSHAGIVTEMYDHTSFEEDKYGFTGFLNSSAAAYSPEVRKELVLNQLRELLGAKVMEPATYFDKVWNDEFIAAGSPVIIRPHQHNGHPAFFSAYMGNRLHFCGTETAAAFPGYMEGAVIAARLVGSRL
ncbi:amine oxidase [Niabella ginsenosidivorans]|uniref:Amine oxidase n=1 Tax=Niabella ginsenosidivorans TaxID=1176587 RepID=A0A1A9I1C2_9BACT|nr:NAD(P)/FAD-dependent oxidoreductase [Niabella ginsenosidivorans]ANH80859.1 amine oxidase [Niabella ginsenosidivorans]